MQALATPTRQSVIHRASPGPKLLALVVLIAAISIDLPFIDGILKPWIPGFGLALTAGLYALAFSSVGKFFEQLWNLKLLILLVTIPQLLFGTPLPTVLGSTVRLTDAMLLATLFSLTTKTQALLDSIEGALRSKPLRPLVRLGLKPETVSLAFAMTMNAIPMIMKFVGQIKEAQSARGLKPTPVRMTIPLLVASLKYSDEFAEALTARGVEV
jgi:biotin transport system permease protein